MSGEATRQVVNSCGLWRSLEPARREMPRVAGGAAARHGALPWQASIRLRGQDGTYHHCGAVVVSPHHVLTTAHCLWDYRQRLQIYYVRVGDNIIEVEDVEEQEFDIEKVDFHEMFGVGPYLNNDIAVVRLAGPGIKFGDKVLPVCLPQRGQSYESGHNITVSGWGKVGYEQDGATLGTNFVSQLHSASLPIIATATCKRPEIYGEEKLSAGMFCAGLLEVSSTTQVPTDRIFCAAKNIIYLYIECCTLLRARHE